MSKDFWLQVKDGDENAFSILYRENAGFLFGYGMKIVSDAELVNEIIQNLFIYIFEKRKTISTPESVRAYLCSSLKRMLIRTATNKRNLGLQSFDDLSPSEYDFNLELDIESALIKTEYQEERLNQLQKSLADLSPQQREVIYLKYYKECSNEEIAEILGVSNQIVRNIASRAIARMRSAGNMQMFLQIVSFLG